MDPRQTNGRATDKVTLIWGLGLMFAVIGLMVFFLANSSRQDAPGVSGNVPSPYEPAVFDSILEDLKEKTGGSVAFTMVVYPEYAIVEVPVDDSERYQSFIWRAGAFTDFSKGTTGTERFDLRKVNPDAFGPLLEDAASRLDLIDSQSINIAGLNAGYPFPRMIASVSNEYGENSTTVARLNGKVVSRGE